MGSISLAGQVKHVKRKSGSSVACHQKNLQDDEGTFRRSAGYGNNVPSCQHRRSPAGIRPSEQHGLPHVSVVVQPDDAPLDGGWMVIPSISLLLWIPIPFRAPSD